MSELKARHIVDVYDSYYAENPFGERSQVYLKSEADKVIAGLQADYKEACGRLQTANLIKDEQKAKADKLISCLKCLVMRDLIKDCPEKASAVEIVKEYDKWTR